jgi:hypothetical protein
MLTDDDLARLLEEAAGSFVVPAPDLDVPEPQQKRLWERRWPQAGAAAAVLVAGSLLLASVGGPGGGSDADSAGSVNGIGKLAPGLSGEAPAPLPATGNDRVTATSGQTAALGSTAGRVPASSGTGSRAVGDADGARIVKTGTLSLAVDDGKVSATVLRLQGLVAAARGYVADSKSEESGEHPTATLTVRVPVARFESLVSQVRALHVKVVSADTSGKDVTASYADTRAQIQSLQAARDRYLDILSRARTIGETLSVQQRVDDVQRQVDRLEGQRRVLADQSDYGTLTLTVAESGGEVLATDEPSGWSKAWDDAKHGFTSGVQSLIAHSGRTLLVLLVGAALLLLGRTGWRLARRRLV